MILKSIAIIVLVAYVLMGASCTYGIGRRLVTWWRTHGYRGNDS